MFTARIHVTLKDTVLDPQGNAVLSSLQALEFNEVQDVRVGKFLNIKLQAESKEAAEKRVDEMCQKLLANPVIEQYSFQIMEEV